MSVAVGCSGGGVEVADGEVVGEVVVGGGVVFVVGARGEGVTPWGEVGGDGDLGFAVRVEVLHVDAGAEGVESFWWAACGLGQCWCGGTVGGDRIDDSAGGIGGDSDGSGRVSCGAGDAGLRGVVEGGSGGVGDAAWGARVDSEGVVVAGAQCVQVDVAVCGDVVVVGAVGEPDVGATCDGRPALIAGVAVGDPTVASGAGVGARGYVRARGGTASAGGEDPSRCDAGAIALVDAVGEVNG